MLTSFISVDTETTGLDHEHDRIIELAAVRFENGAPVANFSALLSPGERALSPVARLITGIRDEELAAAPPRVDTLRDFLAFVGDSPLVAHNADFDAHFVNRALDAEGLPTVPGPWLDSLLLSRTAWPTWDNHRLDSLSERLAIPRDDEHRALPDARRAGFLFLAAQQHLNASLSPAGRRRLARLAADLPDWKLVFGDAATEKHADADTAMDSHGGAHGDMNAQAQDTEAEGAPQALATGGDGMSAGMSGAPLGAMPPEDGEPARVRDALAAELERLVAEEAWLALETPPGVDETQAAVQAALAHLAGPGAGQRILLAVPDAFAWNAARKNRPATSVKITALAEPSGYLCRARLAALLDDPTRLPDEERAALLPLVAWADRDPGGPVADGRGFSPERARLTWARVQCDTWNDDPVARAAWDAAAASGLILVTHATLCAHIAGEGALLPACDAVIVTGAHRYPDAAQSPAGAGRAVSLFRLREILALAGSPAARDEREDEAPGNMNAAHAEHAETKGNPAGSGDGDGSDSPRAGAKPPDGLWKELAAALASSPDSAATTGSVSPDTWFAPDRELQKFLQKAGKQALKAGGNDFRVRYTEPTAVVWGVDSEPVREALRAHARFLTNTLAALETRPGTEALQGTLRRIAARLRAFHDDFASLSEAAEAERVYWLEDGANPYKTTLRSVPRGMEGFGDTLRSLFGAGLLLSPVLLAGGHTGRDALPFQRLAGLQASPDAGTEAVPVRRLDPQTPTDPNGEALSTASPPRPVFIMAPFAPAPPAPKAVEELQTYARFLLEAAHPFCERGVLVFCPSQTAVRALHGALRGLLEATSAPQGAEATSATDESVGSASIAGTAPRVYAQWIDGNRDAITRLYASGRGGLVIASEGIPGLRDADGRAPAVLAVTRMPLPPPRDPLLEARGEPLREEGRNARGELWQPAAVLRLKREWTMLHRGPASPGMPPPPDPARAPAAVWLLDARAATEGLGARLADALGLAARTAPDAPALVAMTQESME